MYFSKKHHIKNMPSRFELVEYQIESWYNFRKIKNLATAHERDGAIIAGEFEEIHRNNG